MKKDSTENATNHVAYGPILNASQDKLNFGILAKSLKEEYIDEIPNGAGSRIGICAPWGDGKTSLINILSETLKEDDDSAIIIHLNPWHLKHTGASLVETFFQQISLTFKSVRKTTQGTAAAESLSSYADTFSTPDPLSNLAVKGFGVYRKVKQSIKAPYQDLYLSATSAIQDLKSPVYIIIDDVDRLTDIEVRELFKFIRQIADFDNVRYLVAYDPSLVAKMLTTESADGREYIDKIIDQEFYIPKLLNQEKIDFMLAGLEDKYKQLDASSLRIIESTGILGEVSIRRMAKLNKKLSILLPFLDNRISLLDVIMIEIIREVNPKLCSDLRNEIEELADTKFYSQFQSQIFLSSPRKLDIEKIISKLKLEDEGKEDVLKKTLAAVFDTHYKDKISFYKHTPEFGTLRMSEPGLATLYFNKVEPKNKLKGYYRMVELIKNSDKDKTRDFLKKLSIDETIDVLDAIQYKASQIATHSEDIEMLIAAILETLDNREIIASHQENGKLFFSVSSSIRELLSKTSSSSSVERKRKKEITESILKNSDLSLSSSAVFTYALLDGDFTPALISNEEEMSSLKKLHINRTNSPFDLSKEWALFMAFFKAKDWCKEIEQPYLSLKWEIGSPEVSRIIQTHIVGTKGYEDYINEGGVHDREEGRKIYLRDLSKLLNFSEYDTGKAIEKYDSGS